MRASRLIGTVLSGLGVLVAPAIVNASVSDSATLTVSQSTVPCFSPGTGVFTIVGFASGRTGSYSRTELNGGETVEFIWDLNSHGRCAISHAVLAISGFITDPGSSWLVSAECNGVTNLASDASYTYASGRPIWQWSARFGFGNGNDYSCTIVHN